MNKLTLDLHGYTRKDALREIQRAIVQNPSCKLIEVVHGFNNGNELKELLRKKENLHNSRVISTVQSPCNEGRAFIHLK